MLKKYIFKNCVSIEIKNDTYYPVRFSQKQFEFYKNYSDFVFIRSLCTADIYMEFNTTSEVISFSCKLDNFVRKFCSFDIYENGEFMETRNFTGQPETIDISYNKRKTGISKITIYLPYHCQAGIYNLDAEIIAPDVQQKERLKILAYGDSITQGMFSEFTSYSYPLLIAKHFDADLLNQGVGGMPFCKDSLDSALKYKPDIITVAYGTIDITEFENYDEIVFNAQEYTEKLKKISGKADIYVTSPLNSPTLRLRLEHREALHRLEWYPKFNNALMDICKKTGVNFINGSHLIPDMPEFYVAHGHPNAQGFLSYALNLAKHIK